MYHILTSHGVLPCSLLAHALPTHKLHSHLLNAAGNHIHRQKICHISVALLSSVLHLAPK